MTRHVTELCTRFPIRALSSHYLTPSGVPLVSGAFFGLSWGALRGFLHAWKTSESLGVAPYRYVWRTSLKACAGTAYAIVLFHLYRFDLTLLAIFLTNFT